MRNMSSGSHEPTASGDQSGMQAVNLHELPRHNSALQ